MTKMPLSFFVAMLVVLLMTTCAIPVTRNASARCLPPEERDSTSGGVGRQMMTCGGEGYAEASAEEEDEDEDEHDKQFEELIKWVEQCFPGDSKVQVQSGSTLKLRELQTGQRVLQSNGQFSAVFAFTHRLAHGLFPFRRVCTGGDECVTASHGHYVFGENRLMAAGGVKVHDWLQAANGSLVQVTRAHDVWRRGLYNPQTMSGELVVDGFRVSSYTMEVRPAVAQSLLAPLRAAFAVVGVDVTGGGLDNVAAHWTGWAALRGERAVSAAVGF